MKMSKIKIGQYVTFAETSKIFKVNKFTRKGLVEIIDSRAFKISVLAGRLTDHPTTIWYEVDFEIHDINPVVVIELLNAYPWLLADFKQALHGSSYYPTLGKAKEALATKIKNEIEKLEQKKAGLERTLTDYVLKIKG